MRSDEKQSIDDDFHWMAMPIVDPSRAIQRVVCPSMEQFLTDYMQTKTPVILTGCIDHWPAMNKWRWTQAFLSKWIEDESSRIVVHTSFQYLLDIAGERTVPIELGSRYSDDDWTQKLMTIADFVKHYCQRRVTFDRFSIDRVSSFTRLFSLPNVVI
jgi:[protein]-arginine 3-hydroxylase / protease